MVGPDGNHELRCPRVPARIRRRADDDRAPDCEPTTRLRSARHRTGTVHVVSGVDDVDDAYSPCASWRAKPPADSARDSWRCHIEFEPGHDERARPHVRSGRAAVREARGMFDIAASRRSGVNPCAAGDGERLRRSEPCIGGEAFVDSRDGQHELSLAGHGRFAARESVPVEAVSTPPETSDVRPGAAASIPTAIMASAANRATAQASGAPQPKLARASNGALMNVDRLGERVQARVSRAGTARGSAQRRADRHHGS